MSERPGIPPVTRNPFGVLSGLVGQKIQALSTTSDDGELLGFHLLGEDGYAVTVKGSDLEVGLYEGWKIGA